MYMYIYRYIHTRRRNDDLHTYMKRDSADLTTVVSDMRPASMQA